MAMKNFNSGKLNQSIQFHLINNKLIIEYFLISLKKIKIKNRLIIIVDNDKKKLLTKILYKLNIINFKIITVNQTAGSLCSVLMASDYIDNSPLLILNSDQIFPNINLYLKKFIKNKNDCGFLYFSSKNSRWAYAIFDDDILREISIFKTFKTNAIAGFYFFKNGDNFLEYSQKIILKSWAINDIFYVAEVINEYILSFRNISYIKLNNNDIIHLYSPEMIYKNYSRLENGDF